MPIVNILGTIDDKIESLEKINNKILTLATADYKNLFSNCDTFSQISEIAWMKSGFAFKSEWWTNKGIPVIKIANISDSLNMNNCSFICEDKAELAKDFIANVGDIVLAMTGATLGKFCLIPKHDGKYLINQRVGRFEIKADNLPFLYCTLNSKEVSDAIINLASGSAQPNISANSINLLKIKYAYHLVKLFNGKYYNLFLQITDNIFLMQKLTGLKSLYLKKFFN